MGKYRSANDVDAEIGGGGERRTVVLLRFKDDDVQFGAEEEDQCYNGR